MGWRLVYPSKVCRELLNAERQTMNGGSFAFQAVA